MLEIKKNRHNAGLTVPALSRISGVPVRTIEDLERRGDGRISTISKLAKALNVSLDTLYKSDEE